MIIENILLYVGKRLSQLMSIPDIDNVLQFWPTFTGYTVQGIQARWQNSEDILGCVSLTTKGCKEKTAW